MVISRPNGDFFVFYTYRAHYYYNTYHLENNLYIYTEL